MKAFLVLRDSWVDADLQDLKKGESFRANLPVVPGSDNNPLGEDIFVASTDPVLTGTTWAIGIDKPDQNRWSTPYLNQLSDLGVYIQVQGVTNDVLDYRTVTG